MKRVYTFAIPLPHAWNSATPRLYWVYRGQASHGSGRFWGRGPLGSITVLAGTVTVHTEQGPRPVRPGRTILMPPSLRRLQFSPDHAIISVAGSFQWANLSPVLHFHDPLVLSPAKSGPVAEAAERLLVAAHGEVPTLSWESAMAFAPRDLQHHAAVQISLWQWLEAVAAAMGAHTSQPGPTPPRDPRVATLRNRLDEATFEEGFSPEHLADEIGLSWRRLEQLFKTETGTTPGAYYEHRRTWVAHRMLSTGTHSVKEVAFAVGFRHQSSFSRWFATQFGKRPAEVLQRSHDERRGDPPTG